MVLFYVGSYIRFFKAPNTALDLKYDKKTTSPNAMKPKEIVSKFANLLKKFEPINRQPSDTYLMRIRGVVAPLPLQILHNKTGAMHNLIGLIRPEAVYTTRYGTTFLEPTRVGAYDATISDGTPAVVCERTESAHKAKRAERATYKTTQRETAQFILAFVEDPWVRELINTNTLYTGVASKALLYHLQVGCTSCHALDLLVLHNKMQRYHLEVEGILEYINMLEDAKKLLRFVTTEMLTTEIVPRANNNWEDGFEANKIWAK